MVPLTEPHSPSLYKFQVMCDVPPKKGFQLYKALRPSHDKPEASVVSLTSTLGLIWSYILLNIPYKFQVACVFSRQADTYYSSPTFGIVINQVHTTRYATLLYMCTRAPLRGRPTPPASLAHGRIQQNVTVKGG